MGGARVMVCIFLWLGVYNKKQCGLDRKEKRRCSRKHSTTHIHSLAHFLSYSLRLPILRWSFHRPVRSLFFFLFLSRTLSFSFTLALFRSHARMHKHKQRILWLPLWYPLYMTAPLCNARAQTHAAKDTEVLTPTTDEKGGRPPACFIS